MNASKALQLIRLGQRGLSTSAQTNSVTKREVHPGYLKIKEKYAKFQVDDGVPVHLKGGPMDNILYITTLVLCGVGVAGCFEYYYRAAFPKKA